MAGEDRAQAQHLNYFARIADDIRRYGLFSTVRGAEARAPALPRVGRARRPDQNIVDLAQEPTLVFADTTLVKVQTKRGRTKLTGHWLGLTGPMGPLPTHLTEFAFYERRYGDAQPFNDWLDVVAGRMLQLFYRAWADSQPAASADRPDDDRFARYLAALSGAMEGSLESAGFAGRARSHYAAVFSGSRSAVAIEDALSHLLGQRVHLLEFQPRWRSFERDDQSRLGRGFATLGGDAVLGDRIRSVSDAFSVVIRAKNFRDYQSLLPGGARFAVAAEALDAFKPSHIEWDIRLELDDAHAPPARLDGRAALGWAGWVKPRAAKGSGGILTTTVVRADAHLRKPRPRARKANA